MCQHEVTALFKTRRYRKHCTTLKPALALRNQQNDCVGPVVALVVAVRARLLHQ